MGELLLLLVLIMGITGSLAVITTARSHISVTKNFKTNMLLSAKKLGYKYARFSAPNCLRDDIILECQHEPMGSSDVLATFSPSFFDFGDLTKVYDLSELEE
jgi:hypothetical protein